MRIYIATYRNILCIAKSTYNTFAHVLINMYIKITHLKI